MKRVLYDLAAADPALRFSPYCWRSKLALAHKNLAYDTIAWRFTETDEIAFSGQKQVPVLVDGETTISDSGAIAEYLEVHYPNEPSLFGDASSHALTRFVQKWTEDVLHPRIVKIVLPDIFKILDPKDQPYFRETREAFLGMSIEALGAEREGNLAPFQAALTPLRHTLRVQPFIAGAAPAYADHIVFGALNWACLTSSTTLLEADDVLTRWMRAVLDTYGL